MIQAITFDFWNTLFVAVNAGEVRLQQIKKALERNGRADVPDVRIERAISYAWQEWDRVWVQEYHTFGAEEWVSLLLSYLCVTVTKAEQEALIHMMATSGMQENPSLIAGLTTVLPRLAQDYRLGLICDTGLSPGWMLRDWMDRHGILVYFSQLTFSDELGVSKPHPRAFLSTLAQLDVSPKFAVHIGDYPRTDIAGARGVGMRTIRFTGVYDWGNGAVAADAEIASYSELEPLLKRWEDPA